MRDAHVENGDRGARCISALFRGEDSEAADAGGVLIAEALWIFRKVHTKE